MGIVFLTTKDTKIEYFLSGHSEICDQSLSGSDATTTTIFLLSTDYTDFHELINYFIFYPAIKK